MTYTYKLARRLARLRDGLVLLLPVLAACAAGEPLSPQDNPTIDQGTDGPVAVSPRQVVLEGSQGVLFKAFVSLIPGSSQVTSIEWTATGGTIDASGSYSSTSTGAFKVVGRRKGNPHNQPDTAVVVVVPPEPTVVAVEITPSTATVGGGLQQQFAAIGRLSNGTEVQIGVSWTATGGTIDAGGLYTAARTAGTYKVIARHSTTGLADTAVVTVPPATLTSITLTPGSVSVGAGRGQQFSVSGRLSDGTSTSSVPVAFTATGGSISVNGYYTAGTNTGTFRAIATAGNGMADTSSVTITTQAVTTPEILWNADLESGSWPTGTIIQGCSGRVGIYTSSTEPYANAPGPDQGTRAAMLELRDTDTGCSSSSTSIRTQVMSPAVMKQGGEYWVSESVYFPSDFPVVQDHWFMFTELYNGMGGGVPPVALYLMKTGTAIQLGGQITGGSGPLKEWPLVRGVWYNFLFHLKPSPDPSIGWLEVWKDGQNVQLSGSTLVNGVWRRKGMTMLSLWGNDGMGMFPNVYRSTEYTTSTGKTIVYFDKMRIGTTRDAVEVTGVSPLVAALP